jgi:hypothetical protein
MVHETTRAFRYCQASNKVFCREIFEREFGVTFDNRGERPKSQDLNDFAVHGEVCENAPNDMHKLRHQARISIMLGRSSIRNVGSILASRHSAIRSRSDLRAFLSGELGPSPVREASEL